MEGALGSYAFFRNLKSRKCFFLFSPTSFVLVIECVAIKLRQSRQYKGITLNKQTFKVSLFADDIAIFLKENALQFNYVFDILNSFGQKSGCKVNTSKSNAFYDGSTKGNASQPFSVNHLSGPQNLVMYVALKISINNFDNNLLLSKNCPSTTREVQTLMNVCSSRIHTLLGKIIKIWLFSKLCIKPIVLRQHCKKFS